MPELGPIDLRDNHQVSRALEKIFQDRNEVLMSLTEIGQALVDGFHYRSNPNFRLSEAIEKSGFVLLGEGGIKYAISYDNRGVVEEARKEISHIIEHNIYRSASLGLDDLYEIAVSRGITRNTTKYVIMNYLVSPTLDDDEYEIDSDSSTPGTHTSPRASHKFKDEEDAKRRLSRRSVVSKARLNHQKGIIHMSTKAPFNHEETVRVRIHFEDLFMDWGKGVATKSAEMKLRRDWVEAWDNSTGATLVGKILKGQNYVRVVIDAVQRPLVMDPTATDIVPCRVHVTSVIEDDSYPLSQSSDSIHVFIARRAGSHFELPRALSKVFEQQESRRPLSNDNLTMTVRWVSPILLPSQPTENRGRGRPKTLGFESNWWYKDTPVGKSAPVTFRSISPKPEIEIPPLLDEIPENSFSLITLSQGESVELDHVLPLAIAPSILTADFMNLRDPIDSAIHEGIRWIHLDVMDGNWVVQEEPEKVQVPVTFGPGHIKAIRRHVGDEIILDCHLMITNAEETWGQYADAGVDMVIAHIEAVEDFRSLIEALHGANVQAGCVLNPATPVDDVMDLLSELDLVLVMSVVPGKGGQSFMPEVEDKVRAFRTAINKQVAAGGRATKLMIDGGIKDHNAAMVAEWGIDVAVVGSALINSEGTIKENLQKFKQS